MTILLDTNAFLWWIWDSPRLGKKSRAAIASGDVWVSAATGFEIATKRRLGRLQFEGDIAAQVEENVFGSLAVTLAHAVAAGDLPGHHRDPFDRLLIAQAQTESMVVMTSDTVFQRYDVPLLTASA